MSDKIMLFAPVLLVLNLLFAGCNYDGSYPKSTSRRELTDEPPARTLDAPSVKEILETCELLATELSSCGLVQEAKEPLILGIRPLENRSGLKLDERIYAEMVREKLLNMGHGMVAFRDDQFHKEDSAGLLAPTHWLMGFVYKNDEWVEGMNSLYRYYRVQLRLTADDSGLIVWEKSHDIKNAGVVR